MSRSQLALVAKWESEKEEKAAQLFQQAQAYVQDNEQKLVGLQQYRLDYFKKIQQLGGDGLKAVSLTHHQAFISKLDKACEQQQQLINNARQAANQRRMQWLVQQRKRKAVDMLIDKQQSALQKKLDREEQNLMDEVALQRFVRNR
jgi:flagellar protein FliJ